MSAYALRQAKVALTEEQSSTLNILRETISPSVKLLQDNLAQFDRNPELINQDIMQFLHTVESDGSISLEENAKTAMAYTA